MNHRFFRICLVVLLGLVGFAAPWAQAASVPKTDALAADEQVQTIVWDLTTDQTCVATPLLMGWESEYVSFYAHKGSSTYDVDKDYPGKGKRFTEFRKNMKWVISANNCTIISIDVKCSTPRSFYNTLWTNAYAKSTSTQTTTIIPLDGDAPILGTHGSDVTCYSITVNYVPRAAVDGGSATITDGSEIKDDGTRYRILPGATGIPSVLTANVPYILSCYGDWEYKLSGTTFQKTNEHSKSFIFTFESAGCNSKGDIAYYIKNSDGHYFTKPGCKVGYTDNRADAWRVTMKRPQWCKSDFEYTDFDNVEHVGMEAYIAEARDAGIEFDLSSATTSQRGNWIIASAEPDDPTPPCPTYTYLLGLAFYDTGGTVARGIDYARNAWTIYAAQEQKKVNVNLDVNGDKTVNAKDYQLIIDYVLGRYFPTSQELKLADVNGDGSVNLCDATIINEYIHGSDISSLIGGKVDQAGAITTNGVRTTTGTTVDLPVNLVESRNVSTVQFKVQVPQGVVLTGIQCPGYSSNFKREFNLVADQVYQVAIYTNTLIATSNYGAINQVCVLQFNTDGVQQTTIGEVKITDFVDMHPDGVTSTPDDYTGQFVVANYDVNYDAKVDVDDFNREIDIIMNRCDASPAEHQRADANGDGRVNVCDATVISNAICYQENRDFLAPNLIKSVKMSFGSTDKIASGTTIDVPVNLDQVARDVQFTLNLPQGVHLTGATSGYASHTIEFCPIDDQKYLVLMYSLNGAKMDNSDKSICTLQLAVDSDVKTQSAKMSITDVFFYRWSGDLGTPAGCSAYLNIVNAGREANADVNNDGTVDADDYHHEVGIILGQIGTTPEEYKRADVNGDSNVNVCDVTTISNVLNGLNVNNMLIGKMDRIGAFAIDPINVQMGSVVDVPLYLNDARTVRDVQFTVSVPSGFSLTGIDCNYPGYTAEFNHRQGQSYQAVISSLEGATMANVAYKQICTLQFTAATATENTDYKLAFSDIVDSHPDGVVSLVADVSATFKIVKQADPGDITDGSEVEDDGSCYKPLEEVWETQIRPGQQYVLASMTMRDEQAGYLNGMTLCNQETLPKSCLYTFESAGRNSKGEPAYYIKNAAGHYFTKPGYKVGYTSNVLAAWKVTVKDPQMWFEPDYEYCWDNPETGEYEELVGADAHIAEYREMGEPLDLSSATYCWDGMIIADAEPHNPADPYSTYTYLLGCSGDAQNGTVARGTDYGRNAWRIYTVREWDDDSLNPDINRDGIADEQDFRREIDFILGRETSSGNKRADINRDGSVNVGDVTILSELLRGNDVDDMLHAGSGGRGTVSYDDVSVLMGEAVEVPLYLQYNYKVRDIQFRVTVPGDVRVTGIKCNYDGYTADYHYLGNQNYQVVVSSLKGTMMSDATKKQICTLQLSTDMVHEAYNRTLVIKDFMFTNFAGEVCTAYDVAKAFNVAAPTFIIDDLVEGVVDEVVSVPLTLVATHDVRSIEAELWGLPIDMTIESEDYVIDGYSITWTELPRAEDADTKDYKLAIQPKGDAFLPAGQNYKLANFVFRLPNRIITIGLAFGNIAVTLTDGKVVEVPFKSVGLVVKGHPYELTLDFKKGWNWFSTNIEDCPELTGKSYAQIFDEGVTYVANQTEAMIRDAEDGTWFGGVRPNLNIGFKAYAEQDVDYHFTGTPVYCEGRRITLYPGWTWIPYLPSVPMMVSEVFQYQGDSGDVIKSLQSSATCYAGKWLGDFMMYPGQGYLYYSTRNRTSIHTYPSASVTYYQSPARISEPTYDGGYFDFDCHQFRDNMAIIARIADADAHRYVIGAFHGEECCGKSVADQGYHIITAHGEGGDRLQFVIFDTMTDTLYEALDGAGAPLTMTFNGTLAGTPDAPVVFSLGARIGDAVTGIRFNGNDADDNADVYHLDGRRAVGAGEGIIVKRGRKSFVK